MKREYIKFLILVLSKRKRNFNRLIRRYNLLYSKDKRKNKYLLFALCDKMSKYMTNYDQISIARNLLKLMKYKGYTWKLGTE